MKLKDEFQLRKILLFCEQGFNLKNSVASYYSGLHLGCDSVLLYMNIPSAFTKIYTEDGLALQTALVKSFPNDFLIPYAGYLDIIWWSLGRIAAFFPIEQAFYRLSTKVL